MAEERKVDFAAVGRVARRVDLRDIRLVDLTARLLSDEGDGALSGRTDYETRHEAKPGLLSVNCGYSFTVSSAEKPVAEVKATYQIVYDVKGPETIPDSDLSAFASANAVYHSWPFLRQLVFDFTSRIGFPPYALPVFLFNPQVKQATQEASPPAVAESEKQGS